MKNREVWKTYDFYTSEVTKHARYLGFAGVAICWFFKSPEVTFPVAILAALLSFVAFFVSDLSQYFVAAVRLRHWMYAEEASAEQKQVDLDSIEYWPPKSLDRPAFLLFHIKLGCLVLGFLGIGVELVGRMI